MTPALRNALTSASTRLSLILARRRSIRGTCPISSKQALISASSAQVYPWVANSWISAIASCARRPGRNPYEHGWKSASKMGSSTSLRAAWTTRSATVGIPSLRILPLFFGIITRRAGSGRNSPDFSESRICSRNAPAPIRFSMSATVALSIPGVRDPALARTRCHPSARNSRSQTRLNRSPNRREWSSPAQRCNLACISRTLR